MLNMKPLTPDEEKGNDMDDDKIIINRACPPNTQCLQWVLVKNKMPKPGIIVLLFFELNGIRYIEKGWNDPDIGFEAFGMLIPCDEYQKNITHWMPLPKIP